MPVDTLPKLVDESPETILGRNLADMTAGLDPTDPLYPDVVPGGINHDLLRVVALEHDRVYDRMNLIAAFAMPSQAVGDYLDQWAASLKLSRNDATAAGGSLVFSGPNGTVIPASAQVATLPPSPDADPIGFETTAAGTIVGGSVTLAAVAIDPGSDTNVMPNSVTEYPGGVSGVTVTNPEPMTGGSDVESDSSLSQRIQKKLASAGGPGNQADYESWVLDAGLGIGYVTVFPDTPAVGDVTISIRDINNMPMPAAVVTALQTSLDPYPTDTGGGVAPIGAHVTVGTPVLEAVAIAASITPADGYALGGAGGTRDLTAPITAALEKYVNGRDSGETIRHNRVLAVIMDVPGVVDVPALTLNGSAGDVVVDAGHVANLTTPVTLS